MGFMNPQHEIWKEGKPAPESFTRHSGKVSRLRFLVENIWLLPMKARRYFGRKADKNTRYNGMKTYFYQFMARGRRDAMMEKGGRLDDERRRLYLPCQWTWMAEIPHIWSLGAEVLSQRGGDTGGCSEDGSIWKHLWLFGDATKVRQNATIQDAVILADDSRIDLSRRAESIPPDMGRILPCDI